MVKLAHLFGSILPKRILVAGDFILDRYTFGKSKRISPEAPVPVVLVESEEDRLGGAGNVVRNLCALGMEAIPFGCVGKDVAGEALLAQCLESGICTDAMIIDPGYSTPLKKRIIAGSQQVVRLDYECSSTLSTACEQAALLQIPGIIASVDLLAISDYAKGFLTDKVLRALIHAARHKGIPIICDPKGSSFEKYAGATVLKPNLSEAIEVAHLPSHASVADIAKAVLKKVDVDILMITRSEAGISLYYPDGHVEDHPVKVKEVRDVTGAGDTVLAMLAAAMANGLTASQGAQLANIAATVAIELVGCAAVSLCQVAKRCIDEHAEFKVFSEHNAAALNQVLQDQNFILVRMKPSDAISTQLLKQLRDLGKEQKELVVSIQGTDAEDDLVQILTSLKDVDYIFLSHCHDALDCLTVKPFQAVVLP